MSIQAYTEDGIPTLSYMIDVHREPVPQFKRLTEIHSHTRHEDVINCYDNSYIFWNKNSPSLSNSESTQDQLINIAFRARLCLEGFNSMMEKIDTYVREEIFSLIAELIQDNTYIFLWVIKS